MQINKSQSRFIALAAIGLFFVIATVFLSSSGTDSGLSLNSDSENEEQVIDDETSRASLGITNNKEKESKETDNPKVEMDNFERSQIKDGKKVWEIKAKRSVYNPESQSTTIYDAILDVYENPNRLIKVKAKEAKINFVSGKPSVVNFVSNVNVFFGQELKVDSNQATYDIEKGEVTATGNVVVDGEFYNITGEKLIADLQGKRFEFTVHNKSILNKGR